MVIRELIQELQKYPSETRVLVDGYETGYDDIEEVLPSRVCPYNGADYDGSYRYAKNFDDNSFDVLVLSR